MPLNTKSRQALKAKAHPLKPVVLLGNHGLTEAVLKEIDRAISDHELIKIRIPVEDRDERKAIAAQICEAMKAELVQLIGAIGVFYRKRKD
jgi:RNA-binding protein